MNVDAGPRPSLLAELPNEICTRVVEAGVPVELDAGEVLFREGDASGELYVVMDGELEVLKELRGAQVLLGSSVAGDLIGELGVVRGRVRSATVVRWCPPGWSASKPMRCAS